MTSHNNSGMKRGREDDSDTIAVHQIPKRARLAGHFRGLSCSSSPSSDRPRHPAYHSSARRAKKTLLEIVNELMWLCDRLEKAGYADREFHRRCVQLRKIRSSLLWLSKVIALVGPAGAGKSALLSCTLDQPGLAISSDGARGTSIVHEYAAAQSDQVELFLLNAHYHTDEQIRENITNYCKDVVLFEELSKLRKLDPDDVDDEEYYEMQRQCMSAIERLFALLCQYGYTSRKAIQKWLSSHREDLPALISTVLGSIQEFLASRPRSSGIESHAAVTIGDLHALFNAISRPPQSIGDDSAQSHPWPLFEKLRVRCNHSLLASGIAIADTPGISDSDQSIVNTTLEYIREEAAYIVLVTPVSRCDVNKHFNTLLRKCIRLGKMNSIIACFTAADQADRPNKDDLRLHDRSKLEEAEEHLNKVQAELVMLEHDQQQMMSERNFEGLSTVYEKIEILKPTIGAAKRAVKGVEVGIRNRYMANAMKDRLRQLSGLETAPDLEMIFTSAKEHAKHTDPSGATEEILLNREDTGIDKLKQTFYRMAGEEEYQNLLETVNTSLPVAIEGILACLTNTPSSKHKELRAKMVEAFAHCRERELSKVSEDLAMAFQQHVMQAFIDNEGSWLKAGGKSIKKRATYHTANFHAFCRKQGHWKQPGKDSISWNGATKDIMDPEIHPGFDHVLEVLKEAIEGIHSRVDELFDTLQEISTSESILNGDQFSGALEVYRKDTRRKLRCAYEALRSELQQMRQTAHIDDKNCKSYVSEAMKDIYIRAANVNSKDYAAEGRNKGRAAHEARVKIIKDALATSGDDHVYARVARLMKEAYHGASATGLDSLEQAWLGAEQTVLANFDHRYEAALTDDGREPQDTQRLIEASNRALSSLRGPVWQDLKDCQEWAVKGTKH